jgi:Domain of unknown function (DUF4136)
MMVKRLMFLPVLMLLAVCACAQDVHYNYDRGANFASYKTYRWVNLDGAVPDELIDQAIKRAIDEQLAQKGLTKVDKDADLYIGYHVVVREEKAVDLWSTGGSGWLGGFGGPGWGGFDSVHGQTSSIAVGTLLVDLYDHQKKQLVWRGDASKSVELKKDPDKNYKALQKAMAKLFKNYPPPISK